MLVDELFLAWRRFRCGKKSNPNIDEFDYGLIANLTQLANEIERREYHHGGYRRIVVEEKKRRDLAVADVRDRIVHRLVYDELVKIFDKTFDPDVWSCRKGKGLHVCLKRTQKLVRKYHAHFIWRMDISKFFDNVDHVRLRAAIARCVKNPQTLYLCENIISSYSISGGGWG